MSTVSEVSALSLTLKSKILTTTTALCRGIESSSDNGRLPIPPTLLPPSVLLALAPPQDPTRKFGMHAFV